MLGLLYLIGAILLGKFLIERFFPKLYDNYDAYYSDSVLPDQSKIWTYFPLWSTLGIILFTWTYYILCCLFAKTGEALHIASIVMALIMISLGAYAVWYKAKHKSRINYVNKGHSFNKECIFFAVISIAVITTMFFTFNVNKNHELCAGFTIYGDFSPHVALIRSFSHMNNFPTQYAFHGGEKINYHFMYFYLVGLLEYLGLRIDLAMNISSSIFMINVLMLIYVMGVKVTTSRWGGVISLFLATFRCSTALPLFIYKVAKESGWNKVYAALVRNEGFIGDYALENWGVYGINVFVNQRHIAAGMSVMILAIMYFIPFVIKTYENSQKLKPASWVKLSLKKDSWKFNNIKLAVVMGIFLGSSSFWNGATTIAALLVLFGFAVTSRYKLDYVVTALISVVLASLQARLLSNPGTVSFHYNWGYLAEDKSLSGVLEMVISLWGVGVILLIYTFIKSKYTTRHLLIATLLPLVFAFLCTMTPKKVVINHKFILVSCMLLAPYFAKIILDFYRKKNLAFKSLAIAIFVCMTCTGVFEFNSLLLLNSNTIDVDMDSRTTQFLQENLTAEDLVMVGRPWMNDVTESGIMLYMSGTTSADDAGYDLDRRNQLQHLVFEGDNPDLLRDYVEEAGVSYIIVDNSTYEAFDVVREDIIASVYELVFNNPDTGANIYKIN